MDEVRQRLRFIAAEAEVHDLFVLNDRGVVVAADDPAEEGHQHPDAPVGQAVAAGRTVSESRERADGPAVLEYLAPVRLGGDQFVLEVEENPELRRAQHDSLRRGALEALGVGLALGLPGLYLLAGRSVAGRHHEAQTRSSRDALTGLGNHRFFHESLATAVATSRRRGNALSLALVDVDHFKQVNDEQGHRRGDKVLVAIGAALSGLRAGEEAFRIGGGEFALLLPHATEDEALVAAQRLRGRIFDLAPGTTVSVGIAALSPDGTPEQLFDDADSALYRAKRRGRNQVAGSGADARVLETPTDDRTGSLT